MNADEPSRSGRWPDLAVLDDASADRLLEERDHAAAPAGYVDVAVVLAAASGPPGPDELAGEALALADYQQEMLMGRRSTAWRRAMSRLGRPRVAAAAIALGLAFNAGLSAVATDSLPAPAQRIASKVLRLAGITVPDGGAHPHHPSPVGAPSGSGNGSAPAAAGSGGNPAQPPSVSDAARNGSAGLASPGATELPPAVVPSQQGTGVVRGGGGAVVVPGGHGRGPAIASQPFGAPGRGNGNAWGHVNQSSGPAGQSGPTGTGNGNAWGQAKKTTSPLFQTSTSANGNGNGNARSQANKAVISAGDGGDNGNGDG